MKSCIFYDHMTSKCNLITNKYIHGEQKYCCRVCEHYVKFPEEEELDFIDFDKKELTLENIG
jgi:hypothetical protein